MKTILIFPLFFIAILTIAHSDSAGQNVTTDDMFAVQILLSEQHLDPADKKFKGITDISEEICSEILKYKYTTGKLKTFQEAAQLRLQMIEKGFKDAFVVHYHNGARTVTKSVPTAVLTNISTNTKAEPSQDKPQKISVSAKPTSRPSEPEYPGGQDSLVSFIRQNIHYPKKPLDEGQSGRVLVGFTVNSDGKITNANVLSGSGAELDSEAMRIVRMMPDWIPGKKAGKITSTEYILPFDFYSPNR